MGLYCEIVNNLGFALSHRWKHAEASSTPATGGGETEGSGKSAAAADLLDEAIGCAQASTNYSVAPLNLASRLEARCSSRGNLADHTEAAELLRELQLISPPGSVSGLPCSSARWQWRNSRKLTS